ncbi:MAG: peptidoglycan editing factor PgeF [Desulfopila sp.]|jgi:YfiH family protein|nr:peptidoglycan editing factor PgeF [Desulfopila sp.]
MVNSATEKNILPLFKRTYGDVVQGTVSRHGGQSQAPFAGNNISFGVGDNEESVRRNRAQIKKDLGVEYLVSAGQVHGDRVVCITAAINEDSIIDACDALVTNRAGVGLMIGHADCQAILLYDPVRRVIAAIHSGWRGSVANIAARTVQVMQDKYGCVPADLEAGVSPSLGPCCSEFVNYREELPRSFWRYLVKENYFDFWQITFQQLVKSGVRHNAIHISSICTSCSVDYFSYRRACRVKGGITGRNGTVIAML